MSYCRWSTDDFRCDLYCYQSDAGYVTHIATNRVIDPPSFPRVPSLEGLGPEAAQAACQDYGDAYKAAMDALDKCKHEVIRHPLAGRTLVDGNLEDFLSTLRYLKEQGFNFPDYVIDDVATELAEEEPGE